MKESITSCYGLEESMAKPIKKDNRDGNKRIEKLDALRGIAALMVCFFHFTVPTKAFPPDHFIMQIGVYGKYGVEIFFIISGFVLPLSLYKNKYTIHKFFTFFIKRLVRIEIPYIGAIVVILVVSYLSTLAPLYTGVPFEIDYQNLLLHLGYLNIYVGQKWLSPVFWTLAIEFQFYFIIGLLYQPIINNTKAVRYTIYALLCGGVILYSGVSIFRFIAFFLIGIQCFLIREGQINKREFIISVILLSTVILYFRGGLGFACVLIFLVWMFSTFRSPKGLLFVGKISFSLYMLHGIIGGKFQNLMVNFFPETWQQLLMLIPVFAVAIFGAYVFWRYVEKPAIILSKKVRY